jgi:protein-S-isoprenylcysteine O-methyltransferase Ste14
MAGDSVYARTHYDESGVAASGSFRLLVRIPKRKGFFMVDSWGKIAQRTRVPVGTVLGILFLVWMHPSIRSLWIGGILASTGALLRLWAAGHIEKGRVLTQGGPYAFTRNPLYLGSFLMALGIIVAGQAYWLLLPFGVFFAVFYYPVMQAEERELLQGYGKEFEEYSKRVPMFFPNFHKGRMNSSTFLWSRVLRNREHHTVAGLILTEAVLVLLKYIR